MLPDQFRELLDKFSRGLCTPEEEQLVNDWYHNIGAEDTSHLPDSQKAQVEESLWLAINPQPSRIRQLSSTLLRAAAILLPLLVAFTLYLNRQGFRSLSPKSASPVSEESQMAYENTGPLPKTVSLADGSIITLQPDSRLEVNGQFGNTSREVQLTGEAFFDVRRDESKPFVVYTKEVVTRVLGTSFNIRAYDNDKEITVAVKSGKVSVYANHARTSRQVRPSEEVILMPNQQMVYHRLREVISKGLVEKPEIILPHSDLFKMQFENAEVAEIFDVLHANYGVEIRYNKNELSNCRLTTSMSDEGLYERIAVICKAIGASYSIDGAVITIKSNGC